MSESVVAAQPGIAYHVERVKRRLVSGYYQTEPAACFCGESKGQAFRTVDRYGLPHRMCFCGSCGVIYASPRMTADSLERFYRDDYRAIYDWGLDAQRGEMRELAKQTGWWIRGLVEQHGLRPNVVYELGCNEGAGLAAFSECDCVGVDYDKTQIEYGQCLGRPIVRGGLDVLELYGKPADLIILNHVLEHIPDLESTLRRLRALLAPEGMLFIALPTLYSDQDRLYQNAHLWQFTARTLLYVMECCGFEDIELQEGIVSLWKKSEDVREKSAVDAPEVYRIAKFLNSGQSILPMIRTINKFEKADRLEHMEAAIKAKYLHLHSLTNKHAGHEAVIIGGGPSIDLEVEKVAALKQAGAVLFTIERMLPWCMANGVMPDYVVASDAHPDVVDAFTHVPTEPTYLVSLQCHPNVFGKLTGRVVHVFTTEQKDIKQEDLFAKHGVMEWSKVNAGGSVVICSMSLAMMFGCKQLHVFGFDCMLGETSYAKGIAGVGDIASVIEIDVADHPGRVFRTTLPYLAFAQQFIELMELGRRLGSVERAIVYGESLVKYIAKPNPVLG
jgi:SAM-dependent methyltransferase